MLPKIDKLQALKKKFYTVLIVIASLFVLKFAYDFADRNFNKATAEENFKQYLLDVYKVDNPYTLHCANKDTSNSDSRVTCESKLKETDTDTVKAACKGLFDYMDSSCIPFKVTVR